MKSIRTLAISAGLSSIGKWPVSFISTTEPATPSSSAVFRLARTGTTRSLSPVTTSSLHGGSLLGVVRGGEMVGGRW